MNNYYLYLLCYVLIVRYVLICIYYIGVHTTLQFDRMRKRLRMNRQTHQCNANVWCTLRITLCVSHDAYLCVCVRACVWLSVTCADIEPHSHIATRPPDYGTRKYVELTPDAQFTSPSIIVACKLIFFFSFLFRLISHSGFFLMFQSVERNNNTIKTCTQGKSHQNYYVILWWCSFDFFYFYFEDHIVWRWRHAGIRKFPLSPQISRNQIGSCKI